MSEKAFLVLSDGSVFPGYGFGALGAEESFGEVVFCTSMTGYQEMLTDPSFAGQIVVPTFPLQGNYGTNGEDIESRQIQVAGFVVREQSATPSHYNSEGTLHAYLASQGVPGIWGVDTRAITRRIRSTGVMMGAVTSGDPDAALRQLKDRPAYDSVNFVERVTVDAGYAWNGEGARRIAVVDCGVKYNILRLLADRDCQVNVLPATATADEILALNPDGVVFSPGPGDPVHNGLTVETAKAIIDRVPTLGICLGHQIIARALGAGTYKLKFGHRGANHPVQDLATGKVHITAQNHGYAVSDEGLPSEIVVTHRNLNDHTIEGLRHRDRPVITIQYHSEASPGPLDNEYIFDEFLGMVASK
jgi:carbamoyl-phosphate synthase small subunit